MLCLHKLRQHCDLLRAKKRSETRNAAQIHIVLNKHMIHIETLEKYITGLFT